MRLSITRRSDLALRALGSLAQRGEAVRGEELAEAVGTSRGFLGQVMTPLVRAGWISSTPGPLGGYRLRPAAQPSILEVIEAIEGPTDRGMCVLAADAPCASAATGIREPCALHDSWMRAQRAMRDELGGSPAVATHAPNLSGPKEPSDGT